MPRGQLAVEIRPTGGGYRGDQPMHLIPPDGLFACSNVVFKDGTLQSRPGYIAFQTTLSQRPVGAFFWFAHNETQKLVVVTTTAIWAQNAGFSAFADITDVALTGGATDYARFAMFASGGYNNVLITNNVDQMRVWDTNAAAVTQVANAPICKDIVVASNRVLALNVVESGTRAAHRVRISDFNDHTTWPAGAGNTVDLRDSSDNIVCGLNLNRTQVVIYKSHSTWIASAESGIYPFRFEQVDDMPGPASVNAVFAFAGLHYYMGIDGAFYRFDGQNTKRISEPIETYLRDNMNFSNRTRVHARLEEEMKHIWWFWPSNNVADCDRAVCYDPNYRGGDIEGSWWPHTLGHQMTCSASYTAKGNKTYADVTDAYSNHTETYASLGGLARMVEFLADKDGLVYYFGSGTDDAGSAISANFQLPPRAYAGIVEDIRIADLEFFFEKTGVAQNITAEITTTDTLMDTPTLGTGTGETATLAIGTDSQKIMRPVNKNARFLGAKLSWSASQNIEFRGGTITYDPRKKG